MDEQQQQTQWQDEYKGAVDAENKQKQANESSEDKEYFNFGSFASGLGGIAGFFSIKNKNIFIKFCIISSAIVACFSGYFLPLKNCFSDDLLATIGTIVVWILIIVGFLLLLIGFFIYGACSDWKMKTASWLLNLGGFIAEDYCALFSD